MTKNNKKYLIVVGGPTASGKTSLGIRLAQHFNTDILSADSRQFYREMTIGTAKPTAEELAQAKHHFIDNLSVQDTYSVGDYERDSIFLLEKLFKKKDIVIMVGGSGFFIKAVCEGLDKFPDIPAHIREDLTQLFDNEGIAPLQNELQTSDPAYYAQVDIHNPKRLMRALEVCRATNQPFSHFHHQQKSARAFTPIYIGLDWERKALYERINQRVELMLAAGLQEEARALYPLRHLTALQTVGYQEWFDFFDKKIDEKEVIRLIKRNSRRYAKRQMTWFRKVEGMKYFDAENVDAIIEFVNGVISSSSSSS